MYVSFIRSISQYVIVVIIISISGFIFIEPNIRFKKVIDKMSDDGIRKQLILFEQGGIEREVYTSLYDKEAVIRYARSFIGTPHKMKGISKKGIDCSGLVMVVHEKSGISLPHSSQEQARYGKIIFDTDSLKRGDLLFYYNSYNSLSFITHVGIYLGDHAFIHSSSKKGVIISKTTDAYWSGKYLFATRFSK
jgi:lipoprotein Spr